MSGTSEGGRKAAEKRGSESLSAAGKKGAAARTHASRVAGGIKAAKKIGHARLSAAGKLGGQRSHRSKQKNKTDTAE